MVEGDWIFTSGASFVGLWGFAGVLGGDFGGDSLVGLVPMRLSPGVLTDVAASGITSTFGLIPSAVLSDVFRLTDGAVLGMAGIEEENDIGVETGAVLGMAGVILGREILGLNGVFILLRGVRLAVPGEKEKVVGGVWVMSKSRGLGKAVAANGMVVNGCLLI